MHCNGEVEEEEDEEEEEEEKEEEEEEEEVVAVRRRALKERCTDSKSKMKITKGIKTSTQL